MSSSRVQPAVRTARIAGMPRWLPFSLITIVVWGAWGAVSKLASDGVDANTNQVFFTLGLLPLIFIVWWSPRVRGGDRKSTRLNSSHSQISYAVFCLKKKNKWINILQDFLKVRCKLGLLQLL